MTAAPRRTRRWCWTASAPEPALRLAPLRVSGIGQKPCSRRPSSRKMRGGPLAVLKDAACGKIGPGPR
ncbi:hypothetical protein G6F57_023799 [Rhizopus arrhizus]|nr:hypothetical protein G6F57_023799 [Rhizopus arrhizus]